MLKQLSSIVVVLAALTVQARAGVSPPIISGTYYEQNGTQSCGSVSSSSGTTGSVPLSLCQLLFPAPPAGKQLALDSVACQLRVDVGSGASLKDAYLAQNYNGSISRKRLLAAPLQTTAGSFAYYTVDDVLSGSYVVTAPVRIAMDTTQESALFMDCQISGTLRSTPAP